LFRTAELITAKKDMLAPLITRELGISLKDSHYECGRAYDVFTLAGQLAIFDDGQIFSCDLTPQGKVTKDLYEARTRCAPSRPSHRSIIRSIWCRIKSHLRIATNNRVVCKPTELTPLTAIALADILYEAGLPPEMFQIVTGMPDSIARR